ncbi:hypothetical protein ASU31_16375 [Pedobacter ginsenosidimutans]|uniref:Uncharacterized protein n=1 Tax=Pedobacter ginsenosidimutans TaxID=687842 RepID=A0A0T5VLZ0_9SPHI|nr:hypothetical protein ASU31_16375 [Pedobacter ginsenosidimutans]
MFGSGRLDDISKNKNPIQKTTIEIACKAGQIGNQLEMRTKFFQPFCSVNDVPGFDGEIKI